MNNKPADSFYNSNYPVWLQPALESEADIRNYYICHRG